MFGRPYFGEIEQLRIPYMGSKRKIAKQLFEKMLEIKPNAKYFFDLFGGGGAMSFFALQMGLEVHYNEKQKGLVDLIKYILKRCKEGKTSNYGIFPDHFYEFITREKFKELKDEDSIEGQFARICYSFGNNQRDYLFGEVEELKHLLHNAVIFNDKDSLNKLNKAISSDLKLSKKTTWNERRHDYTSQIRNKLPSKSLKEFQSLKKAEQLQELERLKDLRASGQLQQLQQLEQLQRLQQLERLQQLPKFNITNLSFEQVSINTPLEETIIYLDPPYRGTVSYLEKEVLIEDIDNYFKNSPYDCFMSEYNAPFNSVLEIKKESLLNNTNLKERKFVLERLYYNKI